MKESSSRITREEQVKVVVRLKPQEEPKGGRCVYLSQLENQLVVQTDLKKEIFVFDHVAHPATNQSDIYRIIGKEAVQSSLQGYNCSIFAYGQTGAGKTYSIMGSIEDMQQDYYSETRGILPRLLQDILQQLNSNDKKLSLTCSYIEIYNEQIFDLLSVDKRVHHIRQSKKGVFIEGLRQRQLSSYQQGIGLILEGEASRKMALTTMNTQSSRSHAIFTIFIKSESTDQDRMTIKKSKLNIIDLAGSERIKHTNVEGERLKEGCNINRSLHVLANVINSLVQSAKKKKYIPYRDSKLTYYLKDSLGGNSITKVLANIHCSREYFGDTLSTLMFAKRIKNLKTKIELNINQLDNFNTLRQQVRKLREQLAEARYFKNDSQKHNESDLSVNLEKITADNTDYEILPKMQIIQVFEQNQQHYKTLIEIYQAHMRQCSNKHFFTRRNSINMVGEWKGLESRNNALLGLVKRIPSFTKIYKQNILLKQAKIKDNEESKIEYSLVNNINENDKIKTQQQKESMSKTSLQAVIEKYQGIIMEINNRFGKCLQILEKSYVQLESEVKQKDKKIKQILKSSQVPAEIEELQNQNQYLQLNILNLQNQISKLRQNQNRLIIENRQTKRNSSKNSRFQSFISIQEGEINQEQNIYIIGRLKEIQEEALKEKEKTEVEMKEMEYLINELRKQIESLIQQNNKLQRKYERSKSKKSIRGQTSNSSLLSKNTYLDIPISLQQKGNLIENGQINALRQGYTKEIMAMKFQIKIREKQIRDLRSQIDSFMKSDYKIEEQFGKGIEEIIVEYREIKNKKQIDRQRQIGIRQLKYKKENDILQKIEIMVIQENREKQQIKQEKEVRNSRKREDEKQEEIKRNKDRNQNIKNIDYSSIIKSKTNSFFYQ